MDENVMEPSPGSSPGGFLGAIARYFDFETYRTNFRTEILAGLTTFMTMAYILVVNPLILSDAIFLNEPGDLFTELAMATAVAAAIGTALMALIANYPFAMAPGMGMNAFFAYSVVLGLGIDWRLALGAVLVEGIIFILLSVTGVRRHLITAVPESIKMATTVGIGLFLAYIALAGDVETGGAGLIVANPVTKTAFGNVGNPQTLLAIVGIFLTVFFMVRRIRGAFLWGILGTSILGWVFGVVAPPTALFSLPTVPVDLIGQAFVGLGGINGSNLWDFVVVVLVFLFVDIFDTIGTLAGVGTQGGYINEQGELPRANQALLADAIATTAGAVLGTSTVTTYIESGAGVAEGGRTGFTSVIVALLFLLALFFTPLFLAIPAFATAPALLLVGVLMMSCITRIQWNDLGESVPAFLTIFLIPLGFSIAEGLAAGFIAYPVIKIFQGRAAEVPVATWVLAVIFFIRFLFKAFQLA